MACKLALLARPEGAAGRQPCVSLNDLAALFMRHDPHLTSIDASYFAMCVTEPRSMVKHYGLIRGDGGMVYVDPSSRAGLRLRAGEADGMDAPLSPPETLAHAGPGDTTLFGPSGQLRDEAQPPRRVAGAVEVLAKGDGGHRESPPLKARKVMRFSTREINLIVGKLALGAEQEAELAEEEREAAAAEPPTVGPYPTLPLSCAFAATDIFLSCFLSLSLSVPLFLPPTHSLGRRRRRDRHGRAAGL